MFSYVSLEQRVPGDHPLRAVRGLTDTVLRLLSAELDALYADLRATVDCAGVHSAGVAAAGFLFGALERCWSSRSTTTCCFAGLLAWAWMTRCGTTPCSPRIATVF